MPGATPATGRPSVRAVLLVGPVAALACVAGLALASGDEVRPSGPCREEVGTEIGGDARELPAGSGIWTAWTPYPPVSGRPITVLWRSQSGPRRLSVTGLDAEGRRPRFLFGPSAVIPPLSGVGLSWERAGREWGSFLRFPEPGCWHLVVEAGDRRGGLTVLVRAGPKRPAGE